MAFQLTRRWHPPRGGPTQEPTIRSTHNIDPKSKTIPRRRFGVLPLLGVAISSLLLIHTLIPLRLRSLFWRGNGYGNENARRKDPTAVTFSRFPTYNNNSNHDNSNKKNNDQNNGTKTNSTTTTTATVSTIVVQLKGEMGNHLSSIAHGRGIQLWALEHFGIETRLLFRRQMSTMPKSGKTIENPKGIASRRILEQCFIHLQEWDFDDPVMETEYNVAQQEQQQLLLELEKSSGLLQQSQRDYRKLSWINGRARVLQYLDPYLIQPMDLKQSLEMFQQIQQQQKQARRRIQDPPYYYHPHNSNNNRISTPFLVSDSLDNLLLLDRYLDHFRYLFALDIGPSSSASSSCCREVPDADETVFHYRNFATELAVSSRGLEETTPSQTAHILFGHLKPGDKVAITSRFDNDGLQAQVQALKDRGLNVRVIVGQSGIQDFCFLWNAKKELVGNFQSTFALWAAVLGQNRQARLYTVNSQALQQRYSTMMIPPRFLYRWTHPDLKDRVQLLLIDENRNKTNG